ncbi:hypothetical protein F3Y22_tig00006396pilonHSYRG00007 [Hibiscus syriacus]|uniref:Plant bHLH transcription factor ACT-like domain-containing protein n=1 Tax=Hibiscus syriacus TaxID=106335 RepID=A0A6A3CDF1_HIBSY|nr:hypothetical protein F3Y22_tig00006396pilonHSYRG00007 [Hibiscus syriacus]
MCFTGEKKGGGEISVPRIDKESILKDTIKYLKDLEARIEELESCKNSMEFKPSPRRNSLDVVEQTSDNYENRRKKFRVNKRKACDIDESLHETGSELNRGTPKDGLSPQVKVRIKELEVVIEINCPSRELFLLDFMEAINNLLDAHMVQSSTLDNLVTLTLKSKFRGAATAPSGRSNKHYKELQLSDDEKPDEKVIINRGISGVMTNHAMAEGAESLLFAFKQKYVLGLMQDSARSSHR